MIEEITLLTFAVQVVSFVAAFAAVAAAVIMYQVTKKFGAGILANGFKSIASGVLFIAFGIIIDALTGYIQRSYSISFNNTYFVIIFILKGICFVVGTYIIVIGSKKTADKLESLTR